MIPIAVILAFTNVWRLHDAFSNYTGPIPAGKVMLVVCAIALIANGQAISYLGTLRATRLWKYFVMYWVAALMSIPFALHRSAALQRLFDLAIGSLPFVVVTALAARTDEGLSKLLKSCVLACILAASIMAAGFGLVSDGADGPRTSLYGAYDPNDIALVAVTCAAFALWLIRDRAILWRIVGLIGIASSGYILVRSYSRGGTVAMCLLALTAMFTSRKAIPGWVRLAIGPAAAIAFLLAPAKFRDRIATLGTVEQDYNTSAESGRLEIWKRGLGYMARRPLNGVGIGQYDKAEGDWANSRGITIWKWSAAHNMYVEYGAETGVLGLVGLVGMLWITASTHFKRMRQKGDFSPAELESRRMSMAIFLSIVGFCVGATFVSAASSPMLLFLVSLGLGSSIRSPSRAPQARRRFGRSSVPALASRARVVPGGPQRQTAWGRAGAA